MADWKKVVVESASNTITQSTTGSAATLTTSRTISLGSDLSGSAGFDGSANITINANIASNAVGAAELNVTGNGTSGQVLSSNADGSFSWINASSGTLTGLSDTNISSLSGGHILVYDGTDSFDNVAMSGEGTLNSSGVFTLATTIANNHTFSGDITISGNLIVNGSSSSIDVQTLTVEDKSILLSDGAGSEAAADSSGLYVDTDNSTTSNRPHVLWKDNAGTTTMGWSMKDHGSGAEVGIAALTVQTSAASGTSYPAGTLWADSANSNLYIYI